MRPQISGDPIHELPAEFAEVGRGWLRDEPPPCRSRCACRGRARAADEADQAHRQAGHDFISAQPELAKISEKLQGTNGQPDAAAQADLEEIAKKHGFANFSELDDVAANISLIMAGLDAQTGEFTDPAEALTKELDGVKADTSIGETDKKQLVDQLTEAIKSTPKVENKENVGIVKAHRAEIEKALQ